MRQEFVPVYFLLLFYVIVAGVLLYINIFKYKRIAELNLKFYYKALCLVSAIIIFLVVFFTDGHTLQVDRWSAMEVAIRALLNGEYPYTATDHLGGRTSNFPGLLVLGIPFYLLNNVGYLQLFSFLFLSFTLYKYLKIEESFRSILLLLSSPAYWWEIFVISDLMSNIIIALCSILLLKFYLKDNLFKYPVLLGLLSSFLVLTRGIVIIFLALFLFKDFCKVSWPKKLKYSFSFLVTSLVLIALVLINCPDWETLRYYNPFILQTSQLPSYIYIFAIILPFFFSFKIKDFNTDFFKISTLLLFFPVLTAFILKWNVHGFENIIFKHRFDISYLSIVLPFLIIEVVKNGELKQLQSLKKQNSLTAF